jgi:MFS family permease
MIREKLHPQLKLEKPGVLRHAFRALESRNFRLFLSGQLVSLIGTWMQQVAMSWLLYRMTHSALLLGLIAFLGQGPGFFIAPFAGTLADRVSRHKILLATQTLSMAQALALAYLVLTGQVQIWHLFYLSSFLGIVTAFDIPVRQAFVLDMLDKPEDLSNAISLNSSVFNGTRLVGPAIAGIAIASVGEGWCFFLNALSYIAVLVALLSMRLRPRAMVRHTAGYLESLRQGFSYAYGFPPIRAVLLLVALVSLVGLPYSVLVPVYAKDILHGGAHTLGYLMGTIGAGALTGALYLALRRDISGLGSLIPCAVCLFALALIGFAISRTFWVSLILMYLLGLGMMLHLASSQILLQTLAEDDKRGRVMSLYSMSFLGMTPFGSLIIGFLATHIGVTLTLTIGGILCFVAAIAFACQLPVMRQFSMPVYEAKGIACQPVNLPKKKAVESSHSH